MSTNKFNWILAILLCLVSVGSYLKNSTLEKKAEDAYEQGYQEGSIHTVELLQSISEVSPEETRDIAVKWWTNTKNMKAARDALCGNIKPKKKE